MKVGILQLSVGPNPDKNLPETLSAIDRASAKGAELICTPEVTGFITTSAKDQARHVVDEAKDVTLAALCERARQHGIWIAIGSLAVATDDPDGRYANRSFLIDPHGAIAARYDKLHMFDVVVSETERYLESRRYRPGERAVIAKAGEANLGLTVCYDVRFPHLYRALAQAGAQILLVPSAFSPTTGPAHWEPLLRARAIETGCFVIAAAQTGVHTVTPKRRETYGHSMVINPWGEVLLDAGQSASVHVLDIDLTEVGRVRQAIPSLSVDRPFEGPQ